MGGLLFLLCKLSRSPRGWGNLPTSKSGIPRAFAQIGVSFFTAWEVPGVSAFLTWGFYPKNILQPRLLLFWDLDLVVT